MNPPRILVPKFSGVISYCFTTSHRQQSHRQWSPCMGMGYDRKWNCNKSQFNSKQRKITQYSHDQKNENICVTWDRNPHVWPVYFFAISSTRYKIIWKLIILFFLPDFWNVHTSKSRVQHQKEISNRICSLNKVYLLSEKWVINCWRAYSHSSRSKVKRFGGLVLENI